eukprot:TRINITY_DN3466_c0_g1_i2.p1 TRINITY_DN3466_c0_g1~~TRINITY_DN3466_c0_g1_i2.p1  ORF type:complete len:278 (-),score=113.92 TRINITY_DN3466_c0_g1_i2:477-1268(-)
MKRKNTREEEEEESLDEADLDDLVNDGEEDDDEIDGEEGEDGEDGDEDGEDGDDGEDGEGGVDSDEEGGSDEEEGGKPKLQDLLAKYSRENLVNDQAGIKEALKNITLEKLPWLERLDITSTEPVVVDNVHDDFKRELAIFQATIKGVLQAQMRLDQLNFPHRRPDDYFAEMLKSDDHMKKVRLKLLHEKQRIEEFEEKKKQQEMKKFGKKVQVEKQQQKQKQKKDTLAAIKQWREKKDSSSDGFDIGLEEDAKKKTNEVKKR